MTIEERYRLILKENIEDPEVIKFITSYGRRMHLSRTLGHFEIYKQIATLPGDILEVGVYKGESLLNWARFVETLNTGDRAKYIYGFDHWKGLTNFQPQDGGGVSNVGNVEGGWNPGQFHQTLRKLVDLFHEDSFVPMKPRIQLVDGDISQTGPEFTKANPGLRIALLHLDCDLYQPTLAALKAFYPHVVEGGIVLLDEYGIREWPGESSAFEEYFEGCPPQLEKFPWLSTPGGWFRKTTRRS